MDGLETCTRNSLTLGLKKKCRSNCGSTKLFFEGEVPLREFCSSCAWSALRHGSRLLWCRWTCSGIAAISTRDNDCAFDAAEQDLGWSWPEAEAGVDHSTSELHMKKTGICIYVCICGVCVGGFNKAKSISKQCVCITRYQAVLISRNHITEK